MSVPHPRQVARPHARASLALEPTTDAAFRKKTPSSRPRAKRRDPQAVGVTEDSQPARLLACPRGRTLDGTARDSVVTLRAAAVAEPSLPAGFPTCPPRSTICDNDRRVKPSKSLFLPPRVRRSTRVVGATTALCALLAFLLAGRASPSRAIAAPDGAPVQFGAEAERATTSRRCAVCHPAIYAEHVQNTHGAAFKDDEARVATRNFRRENCIRCHTPRPVAETGLGMVPIERRHDLEEGNTCMSCHAKAGYDYAKFRGGPECKVAFDGRVGTVEACATCHRIAGTPEQWEHAEHGKLAGNVCIDCHMPIVERPVAVGMPPRPVRAHVFPASRSEDQLRRAYSYDVRIEGDEAVVTLANVGAGHNFPTATIQRAVESLVVVRDAQGKEVARDRAFTGFPYPDPKSLRIPRPTQLPSGKSREQRVRLPSGQGTVECSLFFKVYHPVEDDHPTLSRRLEWRTLPFSGVVAVEHPGAPPKAPTGLPAVSPADAARPEGLAKYAHLAPEVLEVPIPEGSTDDDLARLVAILEFPVPAARVKARERLVAPRGPRRPRPRRGARPLERRDARSGHGPPRGDRRPGPPRARVRARRRRGSTSATTPASSSLA